MVAIQRSNNVKERRKRKARRRQREIRSGLLILDFKIDRSQVVGFRKGRRRQDVP